MKLFVWLLAVDLLISYPFSTHLSCTEEHTPRGSSISAFRNIQTQVIVRKKTKLKQTGYSKINYKNNIATSDSSLSNGMVLVPKLTLLSELHCNSDTALFFSVFNLEPMGSFRHVKFLEFGGLEI